MNKRTHCNVFTWLLRVASSARQVYTVAELHKVACGCSTGIHNYRFYARLLMATPSAQQAYTLRRFYQYFDHFLGLRMWKMQLLDERHLLVKYASEDVVTLQVQDPNSQPSFFMVYNMDTTEVLGVYENTSEELAQLFENFCDMFRNASLYYEVGCG